jgi:UDP-N-acetylmuramoyl-L-alanyl-D-glutamate--2,6-diaminopimelate ligase
MLDGGDAACAMEVSSHALELARADAIRWDVAVFTNLTQDHLDFHPSMEEYFLAKKRLFDAAGDAVKIVNVDDEYGRRLAYEHPEAVTYSLADALDLSTGFTGSRFVLDGVVMATPHPGPFNVLNALAAIHAARALGVADAVIARALPQIGRVPGRFEPVDEGQDFAVIVDYSHTPDSLDNVLRAARDLAGQARVICVFGCGGDRDRAKRPLMGAIADELADRAIVTSDNPRSEDPEAIIAEVVEPMHDPEWTVDRREAIERAVAGASSGDVVVIAGKGHEQGQEFEDGRKVPFDDVEVAREALREVTHA